jgi:uncharacterized membrane protein YkoI
MVKTADKVIFGILAILLVGMSGVFITAISGNQDVVEKERHSKQDLVTEITPDDAKVIAMRLVPGELGEVETEEEDVAITGTPLEQASAAALAHIGEGRVTDSEIGDEEGYYEIEITLDNGDEVDVHLDQDFNVLSTEWD